MSSLTIDSTVRMLGGYELPRIGFGVALVEDVYASCIEAVKAGYRLIDSAQHYENEELVGKAVRECGVSRRELVITTKVRPGTVGYESTAQSIDESLHKLGLDYVDLFLIHDPKAGPSGRMDKYRALLAAKREGKIHSVGVSSYGVKHLEEIREAGLETPSVNQIELHPFNQQRDIIEYCRKHSIIVEAFCPLVRGKMADPIIVDLAKKHSCEPAQILIRWSLQKGFVPLPKSSTPARIVSNANVYGFTLSDEDVAKLDSLDQGKAGSVSWNPVDVE